MIIVAIICITALVLLVVGGIIQMFTPIGYEDERGYHDGHKP